MVTSSTAGRCRSRSARSRPERSASSATDPTQVSVPAVVAAPHRQRRAPEAVAGERPVDVVLEPVAEAAVLDVLRVPADRLVLAQHLVLVRGGAREPGGLGPVDERRAAPPAVRVRVRVVDQPLESARRRERVDDRGVGVLHEHARPRCAARGGVDERRRRPHRVEHRQALGVGDLAVDLAERGREVHDAGAVVDGHEVGGDHPPRRTPGARGARRGARTGGRRGRTTATAPTTSASSPKHVGDARRRHHEVAPAGASGPARTRRRAPPRRRRSTPASTGWSSTRGGRSRGRRPGSARRPTGR